MQIIELISILAVYIPALIVANTYRKKASKPISWWKIIVTFFIGLFSFSIPFQFFGETHKFALIPIGAFIFYIVTRKNRWYTYRPFIWIGFFANYLFFVISIVTVPIQHMFYPPDELSTYVKTFEQASVTRSHIAASNNAALITDADSFLTDNERQSVTAYDWYLDYTETQHSYTEEEFPYLLMDVEAPFGMTIPFNIFVNKTGDGLLVITEKEQFYFEIASPILTFGGERDA